MSAYPNVKTIFHDPDYYVEAFSAHARLSSKYQVLATWADTVFQKKMVDRLTVDLSDTNGKLKVLGVGSGTGGMDCKMLGQLLAKYPNISNTVIEPVLQHITEYKALASSKGFTGIEWDWQQQTWEQYHQDLKKAGNEADKMHFISAIHSLYYVDDQLETIILALFDYLREGGKLLMILISDDSGIYRLWNQFPMFADNLHTQLNSKHIRDVLTKHKIEYEAVKQESRVDITCCFQEGDKNGPLVADFLTHTLRLRETAPSKLVDEVMGYMGGPECSSWCGEQLLLSNDWEAIIVTK